MNGVCSVDQSSAARDVLAPGPRGTEGVTLRRAAQATRPRPSPGTRRFGPLDRKDGAMTTKTTTDRER
jgi:hypothetical protein